MASYFSGAAAQPSADSGSFLGYIPYSEAPKASARNRRRGGERGGGAGGLPSSIIGKLASWFGGGGAVAGGDTAAAAAASSSEAVSPSAHHSGGGNGYFFSPQPRIPTTAESEAAAGTGGGGQRKKRRRAERREQQRAAAEAKAEDDARYFASLRADPQTGEPLGDAVRSTDDGLPIRDFLFASAAGRQYYSTRDEICKPFGFYHGQRAAIGKGPLIGLRVVIVGVHGGQLHGIFEGESEASPFLRCYNGRQLQEAYALEALTGPRAVKILPLASSSPFFLTDASNEDAFAKQQHSLFGGTAPEPLPARVVNFLRYAPDLTLEISLDQNDGNSAAEESARVAAVLAAAERRAEREKERRQQKEEKNQRRRGKAAGKGVDAEGDVSAKVSAAAAISTAAKLAALRTSGGLSAAATADELRLLRSCGTAVGGGIGGSRRSISFADAAHLEIASPPSAVQTAGVGTGRAVLLSSNSGTKRGRHNPDSNNSEGEDGDDEEEGDWFLNEYFGEEGDEIEEEEEEEEEDDDTDSDASSDVSDDDNVPLTGPSNPSPFAAVNPYIPYAEPQTPRPGVVIVYLTPTYSLANGGAVGWSGEAMQPISGAGNVRRVPLFDFNAAAFVRAKKEVAETLAGLVAADGGLASSSSSTAAAASSSAFADSNSNSNANAEAADAVLSESMTVLEAQKRFLLPATQPMLASISATIIVPLVLSHGAVEALASTVEGADGAADDLGSSSSEGEEDDEDEKQRSNFGGAPPAESVSAFLKKVVNAAEASQARAQAAAREAQQLLGVRSEFEMDAEFLAANR